MAKIVDDKLAPRPMRVKDDADLERLKLLDIARCLRDLELRDVRRRWANITDPILLGMFDADVKAGRDYSRTVDKVAKVVRDNAPRFR